MSSCMEEMQQVTQQLSAAITAVSARYEEELNGYLKEMVFIL